MLRMVNFARIALVVTVFLAAGCQPVRPLAQTPEAPAAEAASPTADATAEVPAATSTEVPVGGAYDGKLSIAGMELDIVVTLQAPTEGDSSGAYSGTIDIPQQSATDIPLHDIAVDGTIVHFEMLTGPQTAKFDGEIAADGTISGKMAQSGYEGTFSLAPQQAAEKTPSDSTTDKSSSAETADKPQPAGVSITW